MLDYNYSITQESVLHKSANSLLSSKSEEFSSSIILLIQNLKGDNSAMVRIMGFYHQPLDEIPVSSANADHALVALSWHKAAETLDL